MVMRGLGERLGRGACAGLVLLLAGCGGQEVYPNDKDVPGQQPTYTNQPSNSTVFSGGGILSGVLGGGSKSDGGGGGPSGTGVAVNAFLWRASLDTIAFMPLVSADPFGGVIITDWYQPNGAADERFKLSIFILDRNLRADGLRVTVFRQTRDASGTWIDTPADPKTATQMENAILTRANQLRVASGTAAAN